MQTRKSIFRPLYAKWAFEIYLPKLVGFTSPKEFPAFKLMRVAVLIVPCEDVVYGFSGEHYALNAIHRFQNEAWQVVDALLYACGSPFESGSQFKN